MWIGPGITEILDINQGKVTALQALKTVVMSHIVKAGVHKVGPGGHIQPYRWFCMALKMMLGFVRSFPLSHFCSDPQSLTRTSKNTIEFRTEAQKYRFHFGKKTQKRSHITLKLVSLTNPDVIYAW